jgi:Gpi18-like mannosyltransferase
MITHTSVSLVFELINMSCMNETMLMKMNIAKKLKKFKMKHKKIDSYWKTFEKICLRYVRNDGPFNWF